MVVLELSGLSAYFLCADTPWMKLSDPNLEIVFPGILVRVLTGGYDPHPPKLLGRHIHFTSRPEPPTPDWSGKNAGLIF